MKQVININFQGRVVPIEVTAMELLKKYTESLSNHFAEEESKDEIINDIESRIGELFYQRIQKGAVCITDDDVQAIIKSMGTPEDFATVDGASPKTSQSQDQQQSKPIFNTHKRLYRDENKKILGGVCSGIANYLGIDAWIVRIVFIITGIGFLAYILLWIFLPSTNDVVIGGKRKKLYRDGETKIIAGVCGGIGSYFAINPWIPRALFLAPFISFLADRGNFNGLFDFGDLINITFSPGALIFYIILWLVIPEASTTAEKLEMKGEKIDIDSIKNSVMEEMKGVQKRAEKFSSKANEFVQEKGKTFGAELGSVANKGGRTLGDIIIFVLKIFAYFIIGVVGFALVVTLFSLAFGAIGVFPLKDFLIKEGWQNAFAWGTLLFFIMVPVIGIITWIVRRLAKTKSNSKIIRWAFISLWILGWVCVTFLVASVSKDFKTVSNNLTEQNILLTNPLVKKLELTTQNSIDKITQNRYRNFDVFNNIDEDTLYIKNIEINILKSPTDSFKVTIVKIANGSSKTEANNTAEKIIFNAIQKDSVLQIDKGIAINKTDKLRNQSIEMIVFVPVGKQIRIDRSVGWYNNVKVNFNWNRNDWGIYNEDEQRFQVWKTNTTYTMQADGKLYAPDGKPSNYTPNDDANDSYQNDNYRYKRDDKNVDQQESIEGILQQKENKKDSTKSILQQKLFNLEKKQQQQKDSLQKLQEKEKQNILKSEVNNNSFKMPIITPFINVMMVK
jgi:phage shock protein PspC (stress-responsive transcriptional regulator)